MILSADAFVSCPFMFFTPQKKRYEIDAAMQEFFRREQ